MFTELPYDASIGEAIAAISTKGAFLTVSDGETTNTMTIGWATIGYSWAKPILVVMVRESRHTYPLLERTGEFTVSIPLNGLEEELHFCGTKSGRNHDKISECQLALTPGKIVQSPVITQADLHFECRTIYKTKLNPANLDPSAQKWYPEGDYHTLYFGEILACYELE